MINVQFCIIDVLKKNCIIDIGKGLVMLHELFALSFHGKTCSNSSWMCMFAPFEWRFLMGNMHILFSFRSEKYIFMYPSKS